MSSERLADGRWQHKFRQSFLGELQMCPEKARASYFGEVERGHTDSTALGTAVHASIEYALVEKRDSGVLVPLGDMIELGNLELDAMEWQHTKLSEKRMRSLLGTMVGAWHSEVYEKVDPLFVEHSFDLQLHEDDEREIRITGTPDMEDEHGVTWDWKTAGRAYEPWEKQRFAIQPTVYCWAGGDHNFRYCVMLYDGTIQTIDVTRDQSHVEWLKLQCLQVAKMIETNPEGPWVLNDGGWWCSPTWCPKFAAGECKGSVGIQEKWATPLKVTEQPVEMLTK